MLASSTQLITTQLMKGDVTIYQSKLHENLHGLSIPDAQTAWISGDHGTILRSQDSGEHWMQIHIPHTENLSFRDIKAFNVDQAYVMSAGTGKNAQIYKTMDGGQHWELQLQGKEEDFFNCLGFWNPECGLLLCDPVANHFRLYVTYNGETWSLLNSENMPPLINEKEGAFAASGSCLNLYGQQEAWFGTGVDAARVFHTSDQGKNWTAMTTPLLQDSESAGIFSVAFRNHDHGAICGGDYKAPHKGKQNLATTVDGGTTWQLSHLQPQFYWSQLAFDSQGKNLVLVGPKQQMLMDVENNKVLKSWHYSSNSCGFWSANKVLAVGTQGSILTFNLN